MPTGVLLRPVLKDYKQNWEDKFYQLSKPNFSVRSTSNLETHLLSHELPKEGQYKHI